MNITTKNENEVFGIKFVEQPPPSEVGQKGCHHDWQACYDAVVEGHHKCHMIKFSKKSLARILNRIDNKNVINDVKFLRLNLQLSQVNKRTLVKMRSFL